MAARLIQSAVSCGLALAALFSPIAQAGSEPNGVTGMRDLCQTVQARKLLLDDPQLAPLNLGVRVVAGVATLWGPAPTLELAQRAESRLQSMIELTQVRNELVISEEEFLTPPRDPGGLEKVPDNQPPGKPLEPRAPDGKRPLIQPGVEVIGQADPAAPITVHASPVQGANTLSVRFSWLGTIELPRSWHRDQ